VENLQISHPRLDKSVIYPQSPGQLLLGCPRSHKIIAIDIEYQNKIYEEIGKMSARQMMVCLLLWVSLAAGASPIPAQERFPYPGEREMPRRAAKMVTGEAKNVRLVGRWPYGPPWAVVVQGRYAYLGSGGGIFLLDMSDPSSPRKVGECVTPGPVEGLFASGDYLYVADGREGLRIIDISDPSSPEEVGAYDSPGWAEAVHISGSYAYVADGEAGLTILEFLGPGPHIQLSATSHNFGSVSVGSHSD